MTLDPNLWTSVAKRFLGGLTLPEPEQAGFMAVVNNDGNNLTYLPFTAQLPAFTIADLGKSVRVVSGTATDWVADSPPITPEEYGALGDGVTDDATAVTAAMLNAAAIGRKLLLTAQYRCDIKIEIPSGAALEIEFAPGAHLDFTQAEILNGEACLEIGTEAGGLTVLPALSADASRGDISLTVATDPSAVLSTGDLLLIQDTALRSWNPALVTRPSYQAGEYMRCQSVSGTTVTVDSALCDDYLIAAANVIVRVEPCRVHLHGAGNILVPAVTECVGLRIWNAYRSVIEDISVLGGRHACIALYRCFETAVRGVSIEEHTAQTGENYGVELASCARCVVAECQIRTSLHAVNFGSEEILYTIPNRFCTIVGGQLIGDWLAANISGHCEYCSVQGGYIEGGVSLGGNHCAVRDATIMSCSDRQAVGSYEGTCVALRELLGASYEISGLKLRLDAASTYRALELDYGNGAYPILPGTIKVSDIDIYDNYGVTIISACYGNGQDSGVVSLDMRGIRYTSATGAAARIAVSSNAGSGHAFKSVSISDVNCAIQAWPMRSLSTTISGVTAREGTTAQDYGVKVVLLQLAGSKQLLRISDCDISGAEQSGVSVDGTDVSYDTDIEVTGCKIINCGQGLGGALALRSSVFAQQAAQVVLSDLTVGDTQAVQTQIYQYAADTVAALAAYDVRDISTAAALQPDTTAVTSWIQSTLHGSGSPESAIEAHPGTLYRDISAGVLYTKATGTGSTGWGTTGATPDPLELSTYLGVGSTTLPGAGEIRLENGFGLYYYDAGDRQFLSQGGGGVTLGSYGQTANYLQALTSLHINLNYTANLYNFTTTGFYSAVGSLSVGTAANRWGEVFSTVYTAGSGSAAAGTVRLPADATIALRNNAGTGDVVALSMNSNDHVTLGSGAEDALFDVAANLYGRVNGTIIYAFSETLCRPITDDAVALGSASYRWSETHVVEATVCSTLTENVAALLDDTATTFTLAGGTVYGIYEFTCTTAGAPKAVCAFRAQAAAFNQLMSGVNTGTLDLLNNTALAGTTGTDGNVSISVNDGSIDVENRSGVTLYLKMHLRA